MSPALRAVRLATLREVAAELAKETRIPSVDMLGRSRDPQVVRARHWLWRRLHETGWSTPIIGELCGVDHSSVVYALQRLRKAYPEAPRPASQAKQIADGLALTRERVRQMLRRAG